MRGPRVIGNARHDFTPPFHDARLARIYYTMHVTSICPQLRCGRPRHRTRYAANRVEHSDTLHLPTPLSVLAYWSLCWCRCCVTTVAPQAQTFVHELDLCNFYFFAGQYMRKAFLEDIRTEVEFANIVAEARSAKKRRTEGGSGERQERGQDGTMKGTIRWDGDGPEAPLRSSDNINESVTSRHREDHTPTGAAIKTYIKDVLPEMAIRLAAIER